MCEDTTVIHNIALCRDTEADSVREDACRRSISDCAGDAAVQKKYAAW